jgi:hypothetical protein
MNVTVTKLQPVTFHLWLLVQVIQVHWFITGYTQPVELTIIMTFMTLTNGSLVA